MMQLNKDIRVLWITGNPGRYQEDCGKTVRLDGSWISSLQTALQRQGNIKLALAFFHPEGRKKVEINETTYYLMSKAPVLMRFFRQKQETSYLHQIERVINDFNPDIIQVFGTEQIIGMVHRVTSVPVVIHIQGWMHPIYDAWYPPRYNVVIDKMKAYLNPKLLLGQLYLNNALLWEEEACHRVKYFLGRTKWDRQVTALLAPQAKYFFCSELLRRQFYECDKWHYDASLPLTLVSIINVSTYKGADVILRTAALLKKRTDFRWKVCGVGDIRWAEDLTGIKASDVGVECLGMVSCEGLISHLQACTCFVHLSYIENSPNSICEAQLMGVPVVAANVGGVSTLVKDGETGLLVPANDIYTASSKILMLYSRPELATRMGQQASAEALKRHDEVTIVNDLLKAYSSIMDSYNG